MGQFTKGVVRKQVNRLDGSKALETMRLAEIQNGRVLLLNGEAHTAPVKDRFGDTFQGVTVESDFGYRHNIYSSDPELVKQILGLKHNDRVNVSGVAKRSSIRATKIEVVKAPVSEPASQTTPLNQ